MTTPFDAERARCVEVVTRMDDAHDDYVSVLMRERAAAYAQGVEFDSTHKRRLTDACLQAERERDEAQAELAAAKADSEQLRAVIQSWTSLDGETETKLTEARAERDAAEAELGQCQTLLTETESAAGLLRHELAAAQTDYAVIEIKFSNLRAEFERLVDALGNWDHQGVVDEARAAIEASR